MSLVKSSRGVLLAFVEIAAVFLLAVGVAHGLRAIPAVEQALAFFGEDTAIFIEGWLPLVMIALAADLIFRRRGLRSWGLKLENGSPRETLNVTFYCLVLGGFAPLLLAALEGFAEPLRPNPLDQAATIVGPIFAQEVFLLGFAQSRLRDVLPGLVTVLIIAAALVVAHLAHPHEGELGPLFLTAIAFQGLVWAAVRLAHDSILPQIIAHAALLLLFIFPTPAVIAVGVVGFIAMTAMAHWALRVLKSLRRSARRHVEAPTP